MLLFNQHGSPFSTCTKHDLTRRFHMVRKITICTTSCPYCGTALSRESYGPSPWGPKFGRCPNCKKIYKTKKKLYSDTSRAERDKDRNEFIHTISILIPLFFVALIVAILTTWVVVGLLAFFLFIGSLCCIVPYLPERWKSTV